MPIPDFQLFSALWNIVICSIAAFLLYQVWKVIVVKKNKPEDKGGFYLAVSLVFWIVSGLLDIVWWSGTARNLKYWPLIYNLLRSLLSTWNSVYILFAIHHFDLVPRWFVDFVRHPDWKKWVRGAGIFFSALTACMACYLFLQIASGASTPEANDYYKPVYLWDFIFSLFTSTLLLILIRHILQNQDFRRLAWLGFFLIGIIMFAQFLDWQPGLFGWMGKDWLLFWGVFFLNTYKALLLILFSLILLSWAMRTPAAETTVMLSEEEICAQYRILPRDIEMLRRLARGDTRESITPALFPGKTGREPVDDRQKDLALKFQVPNNVVAILVFALKNNIILLRDV